MNQQEAKPKLGERLAEQIEQEIIDSGWPVGKVLGSEAEMIAKYGVSRAVFREAMRIVDHHGVAEMRRGPGGGLVVVEPNLDAVVRSVSLNLDFLNIEGNHIGEARQAVELACVQAATMHLDDEGRQRIREFLEGEEERIIHGREQPRPGDDFATNDFHLLIAELTKNPAMTLFVQILGRISQRHSGPADSLEDVAAEIHSVHAKIAEAIMDGDVKTAKRRMMRHLTMVSEYLDD